MGCGKQREATASVHTCKTATFVSEFAVEDLPLGRTAALAPEFAMKELPLGRTMIMTLNSYIIIY